MKLLAQVISAILNPLVLSSPIAYALVLRSSGNSSYAVTWSLISMVFTLIIGAFVFVGMKKGMFSNFDISRREQRKPVFIFAACVVFLYLVLIVILRGPLVLLIGLGVVL